MSPRWASATLVDRTKRRRAALQVQKRRQGLERSSGAVEHSAVTRPRPSGEKAAWVTRSSGGGGPSAREIQLREDTWTSAAWRPRRASKSWRLGRPGKPLTATQPVRGSTARPPRRWRPEDRERDAEGEGAPARARPRARQRMRREAASTTTREQSARPMATRGGSETAAGGAPAMGADSASERMGAPTRGRKLRDEAPVPASQRTMVASSPPLSRAEPSQVRAHAATA
mmetsp:Transcript_15018/g.56605  ORF Transcript_15018/g.56605 Transcript_15018/m.56605 type:complete len:229 (-) Transcript_15018:995-1681(-)